MLKANRFACFVVSDLRDKAGFYRNFPMHTVEAFEKSGLRFYNDAVFITMMPSLPVRVNNFFTKSRKLGKTHQNVQIFVKGSPKMATEDIGEVEITPIAEETVEGETWR